MTYDQRVASEYEVLWRKVEAAIEAHPLWTLAEQPPYFMIPREGRAEAHVWVRKNGKGKQHDLFGKGPTPEAAADGLIEALDYWATRK